jgi:hypothetical protein
LLQGIGPIQSVDSLTPGKQLPKCQCWFHPEFLGFPKEVHLQTRIAVLGGGFW